MGLRRDRRERDSLRLSMYKGEGHWEGLGKGWRSVVQHWVWDSLTDPVEQHKVRF